jgi:hypothetical protein
VLFFTFLSTLFSCYLAFSAIVWIGLVIVWSAIQATPRLTPPPPNKGSVGRGIQNPEWVTGVYFAGKSDRTALIAMNQLPLTPETLWLRLLGKGKVQQAAIAEVLAFDKGDIRRESILQLLMSWKISMELTGSIAQAREQEEIELMAKLSQAYVEWEQRTRQQGIDEGAARE